MTATAPAASAARPDDADDRPSRRRRLHALLISPGPDLRHLTGYHALTLERLGAWCGAPKGQSRTDRARRGAALGSASPAGSMDVEIPPWRERRPRRYALARGAPVKKFLTATSRRPDGPGQGFPARDPYPPTAGRGLGPVSQGGLRDTRIDRRRRL